MYFYIRVHNFAVKELLSLGAMKDFIRRRFDNIRLQSFFMIVNHTFDCEWNWIW